jgi:hypothetical protein
MSQGTPFANVLLVADCQAAGMKPLAITHYTVVSRAGPGPRATLAALQAGRSGLRQRRLRDRALGTWLGVVDGLDALDWPAELADFDCRNNRLAELGLRADGFAEQRAPAAQRFGAARVGVFLGTSTSGILQTELAYRHRDPATGALPADLHYARRTTPIRWRATCASAGPAGAGGGGQHRLLVQRQGLRPGARA